MKRRLFVCAVPATWSFISLAGAFTLEYLYNYNIIITYVFIYIASVFVMIKNAQLQFALDAVMYVVTVVVSAILSLALIFIIY